MVTWGMSEDGRETVVPTTMAIKPPLTAASNCGSKAGREGGEERSGRDSSEVEEAGAIFSPPRRGWDSSAEAAADILLR